MNKISRLQALLTIGVLAVGVTSVALGDDGNNTEVRLRTRLAGAAINGKTPEGNAEFRSESSGRTRFKVEVENVNLAAGTTLNVSVQHGATTTLAGHITLDAFGFGELELDSQDGDVVPPVVKGDMVIVSNGATPILSGVF